jgi:transposase-like protein
MKPGNGVEFWREAVMQQERSGQSVRSFCQQRGFAEHSFYAWRKRVRRQASVTFALVETNRPPATLPTMIEVALPSGERLRIPCEAAALRVVLGVLREARV